jgi:hypothetical protein
VYLEEHPEAREAWWRSLNRSRPGGWGGAMRVPLARKAPRPGGAEGLVVTAGLAERSSSTRLWPACNLHSSMLAPVQRPGWTTIVVVFETGTGGGSPGNVPVTWMSIVWVLGVNGCRSATRPSATDR